MSRIVSAFALVVLVGIAAPALAQIQCGDFTCCTCTKHFGCVHPQPGQWGTQGCEQLCTGAPLPQNCIGMPLPSGETGPAKEWRPLTTEEYLSQFMSIDPVLAAAAAEPISKPISESVQIASIAY